MDNEEKSQKDRVLTASKTIWMLTSWHKTLVPALGVGFSFSCYYRVKCGGELCGGLRVGYEIN